MNRTTWLAVLALLAFGTAASCEDDKKKGNCLVADACCALADEQGKPSEKGAADCEGEDLTDDGWGPDLDGVGLEDHDGVLQLRPNTVTRVPVVWITSTDENKVAKYDSVTGSEVLRVTTWGAFPNRTAVASDGTVWITNRNSGTFVHIDTNGEILCSSPAPGVDGVIGGRYTRGATIDPSGFAWIADYNNRIITKVDPKETEGETQVTDNASGGTGETKMVPKCLEVASVQLASTYPYGLASDREGMVWVGTLGSGTVAKIDGNTATLIGEYTLTDDPMMLANPAGACWNMYGMTLDIEGNPWFANTSCGSMIRLNKATGEVNGIFMAPEPERMGYARAAGLDRRGHVWVADNTSQWVHEFDEQGNWVKRVDVNAACFPGASGSHGTLGTGSDTDGNMWTVLQYAGKVVKYTTDGTILGCYPDGVATPNLAGPYTYSDLTGSTLDLVTSTLGRWRGRVDSPAPLHWLLVSYKAKTPTGTKVCSRVRAANDATALQNAPWSDAYCDSAGRFKLNELGGPVVGDSNLFEVELQLSSQDKDVTPQVSNLSVAAKAP